MRNYKEIIRIKSQLLNMAANGLANSFYHIDQHQRDTVLNDTILKLLEKEEQGLISLDNLDEFKAYAFVSLKNHINRQFEYKNRICRRDNFKFIEDFNYNEPTVFQTETNELDFSKLTPFNRALFRWYMRGWLHRELAEATGLSEATIGRRIQKVREELIKQN